MTDEWDEWRQEAAGIVVETAGVDEVATKTKGAAKVGEMTELVLAQDAAVEASYIDIPPEVEAEERALVVSIAQAPQQHVVTGMATLAAMSDEEFTRAIEVMKKGQERVKVLQQSLMILGEDYGIIKGIDRPFLHLPGAEKLVNFYGLAARQEAERIVGTRAPQKIGGVEVVTDEWLSPPLTYHVKTYIHVGSFDGPVVAMGYGESSSWEVKYRYMWAKPKCPSCGREGLVKRKSPPQMAGKWNCPSWKDMGGCNATFEANDPRVAGGKVENTDPWSLAETLIQMAAKRSFVAAARRATGTSGLFTQDPDSPSVQQQAEPDRGDDERPEVENVTGQQGVQRGGRPDAPTPQQMAQLSRLSKEKALGPEGIAAVVTRLFDVPVVLPDGTRGEQGKWLWGYIEQGMTADQLGSLLHTIDTGEVEAATAPTKATN